MKKCIATIFALFLMAPVSSLHSSDHEVTPALSREIVQRLREKYIPIYQKYQGVESERKVEIQTYNSKTGKLIQTAQVHLIRKDYFYQKPEVQVLNYTVDGEVKKASKYKPVKSEPSHPVFDENGDKNYDVRVVGYKTVAGVPCYEVDVTPKKSTKLHYRGKLYCAVKNLDLIFSSGTMAMLAFPLESFQIDLHLNHLDDLTVASAGTVTARFDIPVFMPDRRIESNFKSLRNKPIF